MALLPDRWSKEHSYNMSSLEKLEGKQNIETVNQSVK